MTITLNAVHTSYFNPLYFRALINYRVSLTLRNIALTAPYMHDGSVKTLTEVVEYYDQGGHANPFLDAAIF